MEDQKISVIQIVFGTAFIILLFTCFIVTMLYYHQKRHFALRNQMDEIKSNYESSLLSSQLEIQEQTFQQISHEIHDDISAGLTLSKLQLNMLNYPGPLSPEDRIESSIELIGNAIQKLRDISRSLNSGLIKDSGLYSAIENEIAIIGKTGIVGIEYEMTGDALNLNSDKELIIFRIIQESLNNIIKHANASKISLKLSYLLGSLIINICDNGKGFIPSEDNNEKKFKGIGLKNIYQRTKILDGKCEINSEPGRGTLIKICIPINNQ